MNWYTRIIVLIVLVLTACNEKSGSMTMYTLMESSDTGIGFINEVENNPQMNIFKFRNFYNGGGVAIGDINNDGLSDIYLVGNMRPNKLYLNKGNWEFEDISEKAGVIGNKPWSTGVTMVDINSDGLLDIYVCNAGNLEGDNDDNDLYINNGDLTFTEKAAEYNLAKTGFSTHAAFFDFDKDGDLDAYVLNNSNIPVSSLNYAEDRSKRAKDWNVPDVFKGVGDILFRNDNGKFTDVSEEAGIYGSLIGFGLGVFVTDLNGDLYPDIYVTNDFYEQDYLYINNQDGTFSEDIDGWTSHLCLSAMGVDMGDINNDGLNDVFITDMLPEKDQRIKSVMEFESYNVFKLKESKGFHKQYIQNTLQINNGNGTFSEVAYYSGVAKTDWSWAGLIHDMDNDGFKDIYVTNGLNHDLTDIDFVDFFADEVVQKMVLTGEKEDLLQIIDKMPSVKLANNVYRNKQDLTFAEVGKEWGLDIPSFSNGCAYGDLDNDGDLDLVVNNVNMPAFIFRNNAELISGNNFLRIKLKGSNGNVFGIGAWLKIYVDGKVIFQEQTPARGFESSVDYQMAVGLGKANKIDSIRVVWPNDQTELLTDISVNGLLELKQSDATQSYDPNSKSVRQTMMNSIEVNADTHVENYFNDFDQEGLIAKKLSEEGPALAVADVNGDGNEDVYLGGAKGQSGTLYLHMGNGELKATSQKEFDKDAYSEDTAAAFADIDNDGDQDLIVGCGGNEKSDVDSYYTRIYTNDGKGNFTFQSLVSKKGMNVSVISPFDYDSDGDVDLFIGARSVPGVYGIQPEHSFLVNNGDGTFADLTERFAFDLKDAGMVTDAIWLDYDGDGKADLITVAEWDSPKVFANSGKRLSLKETSLDKFQGWWLSVEAADLDNDGDLDLILGNQGTNTLYKASMDTPMKLWINDFDNNGTIEQITTLGENGKDYPIHMRKELTKQLAPLKKENLKATDYSMKTINELFSPEVIQKTMVKTVNTPESMIMINEGAGNFSAKALPERVQLSCVCGITCKDLNNDGNLDLVLAGNNFEFKPQFSRLDASYGHTLIGDGHMNFQWTGFQSSGFFVREEVKHLNQFKDAMGNEFIFVAINNEKPKVFSMTKEAQ